MPRNFVFAIDVEPDGRKLGRDNDWNGTAVTLQEMRALRERLQDATSAPVRLNWFPRFDLQIQRTWGRRDWVVEACPNFLSTVIDNCDFIVIHVHLWRWHENRGVWFADLADAAWCAGCLGCSIEGYRSVLGARPIASRFGDRSLFQRDITLLRQSGIRYDLTLEPGVPLIAAPSTSWLPATSRITCARRDTPIDYPPPIPRSAPTGLPGRTRKRALAGAGDRDSP